MNIDNMLALADLLDSVPPENFDMLEWHVVRQRCGTVACIGGWATDLAGMPEGGRSDAVRFLGIDRYPADDLFEGRNWLTIPTISAAMRRHQPKPRRNSARGSRRIRRRHIHCAVKMRQRANKGEGR
jgi:hypothetical protein